MPINLLGSNYTAPDTFAFMSNPNLQWMSMADFTSATGSTSMTDYWAAHDAFIAQRLVDVRKSKWNTSPFNFTLERAENNIYRNRNAWNAMSEIFEHGGNILAFDTETIGDFTGDLAEDAAKYAGITEIGFATQHHKGITSKNFGGTRGIKDPQGSFFFGIDSEQKQWLESVLQKKVNGQKLTSTEQSAMERASRHSTRGEHAFSTYKGTWNGQEYTFVKQLNESRPDSILDIQSGIEAMSARYTANRDEQIAGLISHIDSFSQGGKNRVIVGQNLVYDTGVFNRYAQMHNLQGLSDSFEYADSMFALRSWASQHNTTVGEIVKQINPGVTNDRLGSLEALTEAITSSTGYTKSLAHNAFEDSIATLKVFEHFSTTGSNQTHLNVVGRALEVLRGIQSEPNTLTLGDSLVKINSSGNVRSQDILLMDGQVTTGYQVANQYWQFDGVGSTDYTGLEWNGKAISKTQNRYLARFQSVNGDGATLFKAFDDEASFRSWLTNHTSLVSKPEADIALQTTIHDRDIARRVIDGFFDVGQVSQYEKQNPIDAGGFAGFQKYYKMYQDLASLSEDAVVSMQLSDAAGNQIKTASELLANINTGDNIAGIIDYADKHGIESITSNFRTSVASQADKMTAHQAGIKYYDQRKIMQQVFDMFGNNSEFFEFANQEITAIDSNVSRTIAFNAMKQDYLSSGVSKIPVSFGYGIDDLNAVAIQTKSGAFARINVDDIDRGTRQLLRTFQDKSLIDVQVADRLLGAADDLYTRGLISEQGHSIIKATHGASNQPYAVAQSIVTQMHQETESVRNLGATTVGTIVEQLSSGEDDADIIARHSISEGTLKIIREKERGTLLESATSQMGITTGHLSDSVKENAKANISYLSGTTLISGSFDKVKGSDVDNFVAIRSTLQSMHYDAESIEQFKGIYFTNGKGSSNIANFNKNIGEGQSEVRSLFFRSQADEASAFAIFTRDNDYADVMEILSNLDKNASNSEVKAALDGKASFFEIPYLEVFDLGENDAISKLSAVKNKDGVWENGHGARAVFVKQGDDFYRYDTFSFNMYETVDENGKTVLRGGIKDQGGSYLTSIRQRAELGYTAVSTGDYHRANTAFNNPNISRMTEEAAPQMNGTYDLLGEFTKRHSVSIKDVEYAHTIALDPGEGSLGLLDLMKTLTKDTGYGSAHEKSIQAENAIRGIFKAFGDEYNLTFDKKDLFGEGSVNRVYDSEPFKHFYQRYLTSQTGGIGSDQNIIAGIISGSNTHGLLKEEVDAIRALRNDSLLQILAKATDDNDYVSKDLNRALNLLAYDAGLDAVGSESFAHKMMMHVGGFNPGMMNNSGSSGLIRPTYTQRGNYRSYRLDERFFTNPDEMSTRLGIKFGDAYTTQQYIDFISKLDEQSLSKAGEAVTAQNVSRRNIVGAVQSMSDAEIRAGRDEALDYIRLKAADLGMDQTALEKIYDRMINDINTYEGKAYVRPSVANQEFFALGDPKNIRSAQIRSIFEIGTEAERQETTSILTSLVGKQVENGTVIGRRLSDDGTKFQDIIYRGQTIHKFTAQNASELMSSGKTQAIVERQLEGFKIMFGEEKATAETLAYYMSIDPDQRAKEVQETLASFGLQPQTDIQANIKMLDEYTDVVMDAITRSNETNFKTIVIGNNNVAKHLSDTAIDSRWNIIAMSFAKDGRGELLDFAKLIKVGDGTLFDHLGYNAVYDTLTFNNPSDNGAINALDSLITELRKSDSKLAQKAIQTIDLFEKNNIALQSIQRQQMNTFQGQAFKMDQRLYQALVMQDAGNYTGGNGAKLAEHIRSNIIGWKEKINGRTIRRGYDSEIAGIGLSNIDKVWSDIVTTRRGILSPRFESEMVLGTLDAMDYINGKLDINTKNMIQVDASDLLARMPKGSGIEGYSNFIFKVDGKDTDYIRSLSKLGDNTALTEFNSNSFYLDLSKYGQFEFNGQKGLTGIVLPYQIINTTDEEMFLGESTSATIKFFRQLQKLNGTDNGDEISKALTDLFKAYSKELSTSDKQSLLTKALYKMNMPNSSGALAKDAIVPTAPVSIDDIRRIRTLEYELSKSFDHDKVKELSDTLAKRKGIISDIQEKILNAKETDDVVSLLGLTSGNAKYAQYLRHYDENGNLVGNVIESAITTSKDMFKATEMDTGHIGLQLVQDYFGGSDYGLTKYDSFSKITRSQFVIENAELMRSLQQASDYLNDPKIHNAVANAIKRQEIHVRDEVGNIVLDDQGRAVMKKLSKFDRVSFALKEFNKGLDSYLANDGISEETKRQTLMHINEAFENIGDRYAKEVGILGLTGRYPFFNETGVLPVRIYLDDAMRGKEVRFLGPQFSILQNLDFDGDNEFIKFLGNGGLLAKNAAESELMQHQFQMMNGYNLRIFADSVKDSVKEYRYGDEASFKASLLKDLDKASYDNAESRFLSALSKEDFALITAEGNEEIKDLLIAHSKPMSELFADFDLRMGKSINNPDMIKAAIQARIAKEYIGNYSKPNLEIRNAMTYMMSLADLANDENELETLRSIRNVLFTFDNEPGGLLTLLEQKGIDTKHVHDAATLNNSSAWRVGVTKLFKNANGAEKIDQKEIRQSMTDLVEGARKVFFSESEQTNLEIAQEIMSKSFKEWGAIDHATDIELGKWYLSGLYEMSQRQNAYKGFYGLFRTKDFTKIMSGIQDMSNEDLADLSKAVFTLDYPVIEALMSGNFFANNKTDDLFTMFGRAVREGDIFAYEGADGPIGIVFKGFDTEKHTVLANTYDFVTGLEGGPVSDWGGVSVGGNDTNLMTSIRDLNNNTKKYGNRSLLNLNDPTTPERNLNLSSITEANRKEVIQRHVATLSTENNLQWFFDNVDDSDFNTRFFENTNASMIIPGYDGHTSLGKTFANIVGDNADEFRRRIIDINERVQYGIEHGMITGSSDAKELIRAINKEIAKNPRKSINKITGSSAIETVYAYLENSGAIITNDEFLRRGLDEVRMSNQISAEIDTRIAERNARVNELATSFYNDVTQKGIAEEVAFKSTKEAWEKEVVDASDAIFTSIKKASNTKEEMMYRFGWDKLRNADFIINLNSDTMKSGIDLLDARVGYGHYIGTKIGDLTDVQLKAVKQEIDAIMPDLTGRTFKDLTLEELAIVNTKEILSRRATGNIDTALDFTTSDTLLKTYKAIFNPEAGQKFGESVGEEAMRAAREAAAQASREASEGIQKKTLLKEIGESFKNISPETSRYLKIGGIIAGGAAVLGLAGHALFNRTDDDDVEVPDSVEHQLTSKEVKGVKLKNKNGLEYRNQPTDAQTTHKPHKKIAPPSIPSVLKNKTIYHDAASGFNFKVSAQSYNKLQAQSYQRMMNQSGLANGQVNISRDNSRITDNWLENKFAQLTE